MQSNAAMGDHEAALRHFERACEVLPDRPTAICERSEAEGPHRLLLRARLPAPPRSTRKAIDHARNLGLQYGVAINPHNLADSLVMLQDYPRAYGALK